MPAFRGACAFVIMCAGLFRQQISSRVCLGVVHANASELAPFSCVTMSQVGTQGMEEYTFDLSRLDDFLTAKLAPV